MNVETIKYINKELLMDEKGFNRLYGQYEKFVYRVAHNFTGCHTSAKDIQQEVFMNLWLNKHKINPVENLLCYVFIYTRNSSLHFLYRQKRIRPEPEAYYAETILEYTEPLKEIEAKLLYDRVRKAARKHLPEQCKAVYHMAIENDLFYLDIAKAMEITPSTVKNQKARAIKILRAIMGSEIDFASDKLIR